MNSSSFIQSPNRLKTISSGPALAARSDIKKSNFLYNNTKMKEVQNDLF